MLEKITGQLMTRPMGGGKVIVFGVLQVPDGCALGEKDGRQFIVTDEGTAIEKNVILNTINLVVQRKGFVDHPESSGDTLSGLLTRPIWRV